MPSRSIDAWRSTTRQPRRRAASCRRARASRVTPSGSAMAPTSQITWSTGPSNSPCTRVHSPGMSARTIGPYTTNTTERMPSSLSVVHAGTSSPPSTTDLLRGSAPTTPQARRTHRRKPSGVCTARGQTAHFRAGGRSLDGHGRCSKFARSSGSRTDRQNTMAVGTVKFFNAEKGYGFISRDGGDDVFVHYSNIEGGGYRSLEAGQTVEFEVGQGRKGDEAQNVRVV